MRLNHEYQQRNVFCRTDWRFERILSLCDRHPVAGRCTRRDDRFIRRGRSFVLRWRNRENQEQREDLFMENPGLFYAYEIYERMNEDPVPIHILEARLLARQTHEEIAELFGTIPETVAWFEALFFNVTPRIDSRDWITKQVLLPALMRRYTHYRTDSVADDAPRSRRDNSYTSITPFIDGTLKLFAYFGGKHVVDLMLTGFEAGMPLDNTTNLPNWLDHHFSRGIKRRSLQAALTFEVNRSNIMSLFECNIRLMELERSAENQEQQRTAIEHHAKKMIDELPFRVGDDETNADSPLATYDKSPNELRDDDLHAVGAGHGAVRGALLEAMPAPRAKRTKPEQHG
jgi:hypothetical protein